VLPLPADDDVLDDASEPVVVDVSLVEAPVVGEVVAVLSAKNRWITPATAWNPLLVFDALDDRLVPAVVDGDTLLPSVKSVTVLETPSVAAASSWSA